MTVTLVGVQEARTQWLREQTGVCEEAVRETKNQWESHMEEVVAGRLEEGMHREYSVC